MIALLSDYTFQLMLVGTALLGMISGSLGVFAVLRQHSLLGDAIAHAAFPGIALAFLLTYSKNPALLMTGGAIAGLIGAGCVSAIVQYSRLKYDTALGIVLSVFFGFGLVLLTHIQKRSVSNQVVLNKFLFGNAATMLPEDMYLISMVCLLGGCAIVLFWKQFKLLAFDPLYMQVLGYNQLLWDRVLTILLVLTIVVGLQTVGVVLMSTMLIAPAAAARQWTNRMPKVVLLAAFFGGLSSALGSTLSCIVDRLPTGPIIVVIMSGIVGFSLLFAPARGLLWSLSRRSP